MQFGSGKCESKLKYISSTPIFRMAIQCLSDTMADGIQVAILELLGTLRMNPNAAEGLKEVKGFRLSNQTACISLTCKAYIMTLTSKKNKNNGAPKCGKKKEKSLYVFRK